MISFHFLESIFPPVFGRRLQAQVVKKGERVIMDVEITGTPEPTISWFKDGRPLEEMLSTEFRLSQVGICYKLIMENGLIQ
jgi:titin